MDISSMLEVQVNEVKEVDSKENVTPPDFISSTGNVPASISPEEGLCYRLMFGHDVSSVRFRRLHCTACDAHIGSAPAQARNMYEHPVLRTLLCAKCREFYGDGTFEQGDDATDMFCRWCANGGNLYCCSYCSNTFCSKCIKRNFDPIVRKKIEADEEWKCFVCDPTDLYNLRATCWALLQHIESVNRLLQTTRYMTQEQIDIRMNLDETQCCPRRRKRKRRRTGSQSDEDDETYKPKGHSPGLLSKRKVGRRSTSDMTLGFANGSADRITTTYLFKPDVSTAHRKVLNHSEAAASSKRSHEQLTMNTENPGVSLPSSSDRSLSRMVPHSSIYNPTLMNVATASFLQPTSSATSVRQIVIPSNHVNNYQPPAHCSKTPMVTIPNQNANLRNGTRVLLLKPTSNPPSRSVASNVIQIDSDSVTQTTSSSSNIIVDTNARASGTSQQAVPVALLSSESNLDSEKRQERPVRMSRTPSIQVTETFNQGILPHSYTVNHILTNLKTKIHSFFENSRREKLKQTDVNEARQTIIRFHREIRNAVVQLAHVNDRMVREYNRWRRLQTKEGSDLSSKNSGSNISSSINDGRRRETKTNVDIPLDMTCVNESDSESDNEVEICTPSDLVGITNALEGIKFFKKRKTVDQATGGDSVSLQDKSTQANEDVVPKDYESYIGMSVLSNNNENSTTERDCTVADETAKETFGKYQEQFIFYLQHIEDHGIAIDDTKELPDPNQTPLKDLIEANSPFISEMLGNIETSTTGSASNDIVECDKDNENSNNTAKDNLSESISKEAASVTSQSIEELAKMVSNITNDIEANAQDHGRPRIRVRNESLKESDLEEGEFCVKGESPIVLGEPINDEEDSGINHCNPMDVDICITSGSDQDCTIIDD